MPVRISLRVGSKASPFREMLHRLITSIRGGEVYLCSGYIWQPCQAGTCLGSYSVLDDKLLQALMRAAPARIVTIAGKLDYPIWQLGYRNFVLSLKKHFKNVDAYIAPRRNWHAKIAIRLNEHGEPIAGLVGSSNLTRPAYGLNSRKWNFEADVLIWIPDSKFNKIFGSPYEAFDNQRLLGDLHLLLDASKNQYSEFEQLRKLREYVMESGLKRFDV